MTGRDKGVPKRGDEAWGLPTDLMRKVQCGWGGGCPELWVQLEARATSCHLEISGGLGATWSRRGFKGVVRTGIGFLAFGFKQGHRKHKPAYELNLHWAVLEIVSQVACAVAKSLVYTKAELIEITAWS